MAITKFPSISSSVVTYATYLRMDDLEKLEIEGLDCSYTTLRIDTLVSIIRNSPSLIYVNLIGTTLLNSSDRFVEGYNPFFKIYRQINTHQLSSNIYDRDIMFFIMSKNLPIIKEVDE